MSKTREIPQKPKGFNDAIQDAGTRGTRSTDSFNRSCRAYLQEERVRLGAREDAITQADMTDEYLALLSPDELDELADAILAADSENKENIEWFLEAENTVNNPERGIATYDREDYEELMGAIQVPHVTSSGLVRAARAREAALDDANSEDDYGDFPDLTTRSRI